MEQQNYQRINLIGPWIDGEPGLPTALLGLTDETLANLPAALDPVPAEYEGVGYWPIEPADEVPRHWVVVDRHVQMVLGRPKWINEIVQAPPPTGEEINAERDRRIAEGKTFNVSGHGDVALQGRIQDQMALQARLNAALMKKAAGSTTPDLFIRDKNNVIHYLTPDQMIELVSEGINWIEETMQVSWAMKDATAPFTAGAPFDYTEDNHWP